MRDASTTSVFQGCVVHLPVEKPRAEARLIDQAEVESVNSSKVEAKQGEGEMVVRRTTTIDRFLPSACLVA